MKDPYKADVQEINETVQKILKQTEDVRAKISKLEGKVPGFHDDVLSIEIAVNCFKTFLGEETDEM